MADAGPHGVIIKREVRMSKEITNSVITQIKDLLESARRRVAAEVNSTLLKTYWQIGKIIVEDSRNIAIVRSTENRL